jgi:outer membrane immunogenic protein
LFPFHGIKFELGASVKKSLLSATALAVMAFSSPAFAADLATITKSPPDAGSPSLVPKSGLSIGLGGNLNVATFAQQNFYLAGLSKDVFQSQLLRLNDLTLGTGYAGWNTPVNLTPQVRVAPIGQFNYFNHFGESDWMWGAKGSYTYLNSAASTPLVLIPQFGAFNDSAIGRSSPFYGTYTVGQYQTRINHQFALTPFLGRSFDSGFVYVGGGPSLSQLQTNLNNMLGIRNSQGQPVNQTGIATNAQNSLWVFGGAATAGITYFLNPSWYIDFNYTYSQTRSATNYYLGWYAARDPQINIRNLSLTGTGYVPASTSGALNTQSANVSLNWILTSEASTRKASSAPLLSQGAVWTGAYAGLNIAAGWGANGGNANSWNLDAVHGGYSNNVAANGAGGGVIGGGQIGYNYSLTPQFLIGAETDFQGTSMTSGSGTGSGPLLNLNNQGIAYYPGMRGGGISVDWFGTVRGRAGVTLASTLLIYGTGGFAYADVQHSGWGNGGVTLQSGWAAGGGAEWMFMPNWSVKAEYLFTDVSGGNNQWNSNLLVPLKDITTQTQWNLLRAGVNYHFNLASAPFATKY